MVDQNKQYDPLVNSQPAPTVSPPVSVLVETNIPPTPTVILSANGSGVPKWFYFIFGVTVVVFFLVTTLLVLQFTQKQANNSAAVPTVELPKIIPTIEYPTPTLATSNLATDSATANLNDMSTSDDIASIEADLKNTDLGVLDQGLDTVDSLINNPL